MRTTGIIVEFTEGRMERNMEIGKQIKTLRLEKNVKQEELAEYLGVSFQAVSKWETGGSLS